ncbi:MAG TPA: DUF262 domain-containing HNH endonuclease family protein [Candidatus Portnoybacteria bacterium]|nr:DUF262 domain-containing HNH endonuclease family protein [Candidatus Portnoybacteria bacterium]
MPDTFTFDAEDKKIEDILFSSNKFRIPRYQRPYSWDTDKVEEFWNDIQTNKETFFLGSFVFNFENFKENQYIEIIDGQQRLLTITLFMASIRDLAKKMGENDLAKRIQTSCIAFEDRRGNQEYRIECGDSIKDFFKNYIQNLDAVNFPGKTTKEQKLIIDNYNFFKKRLEDEINSITEKTEKKDFLLNLWDKIADLRVIWIEINSDEEAYTIFETVNARGAELTVADLLKNMIFKNVRKKDGGIDIAKQKWTKLEESISETDIEISKFIRHYWLSKYSFVGEKNLYKEIKKHIGDFEKFLNELVEASCWYNKLIAGNNDDWQEIKNGKKIYDTLLGIKAMGAKQCQVLFLSLLRNVSKVNFSIAYYFQIIENFTFNYSAVCKLQANRIEKLYSKTAIEIEKQISNSNKKLAQKNTQRALDLLVRELKDLLPPYSLFEEKFKEISYKNSGVSRIFIKYLLSKINKEKSGGEIKLDFDIVNIEHVLPHKPSDKWKIKKSEIRDYVDLLGNLTLVDKKINSEAGNRSPREKSKILKKSKIEITKEIAKLLKDQDYRWNQEDILKRQKQLSKTSYAKIWKL